MVEFREVLLVGSDGDVQLGSPFVEGACVVAEVLDQGRDKKVLVFKYKNKTRYRRRHGHRQAYTRLAIRQILTEGGVAAAEDEEAVRPARKRAAPKAKAPAGEIKAGAPTTQEEAVEASAASPIEIPEGTVPTPKRAARPRKRAETETAATAPEATAGARPRRAPRPHKSAGEETGQPDSVGAQEAAESEAKPAPNTRTKKTTDGE